MTQEALFPNFAGNLIKIKPFIMLSYEHLKVPG